MAESTSEVERHHLDLEAALLEEGLGDRAGVGQHSDVGSLDGSYLRCREGGKVGRGERLDLVGAQGNDLVGGQRAQLFACQRAQLAQKSLDRFNELARSGYVSAAQVQQKQGSREGIVRCRVETPAGGRTEPGCLGREPRPQAIIAHTLKGAGVLP